MSTMTAMLVSTVVGCGIAIALAAGVAATWADSTPAPVTMPLVGATP